MVGSILQAETHHLLQGPEVAASGVPRPGRGHEARGGGEGGAGDRRRGGQQRLPDRAGQRERRPETPRRGFQQDRHRHPARLPRVRWKGHAGRCVGRRATTTGPGK